MKSADGWQDVAIQNVSAHGMRISVALPPRRGAYIEIRRASQVIVARAVWVREGECGLRTQDIVDVPALVDPKATRIEGVVAKAREDRRTQPRIAETAERSRRFARHVQAVAVAAGIVMAAGGVVTTVSTTLSAPFARISAVLSGGASPVEALVDAPTR
jgi:hypothetical protein